MTIASKLFVLQRPRAAAERSSSASAPDGREFQAASLSPPRRPKPRCPGSGDHHRRLVSSQYRKCASGTRLHNSRQSSVNNERSTSKVESEKRLPDSVRQARERLLLRLRSVNLSGSRETDTDSGNQQTMCRSQSQMVHSFCEFTKRPIFEISQVIHGLKDIIFRTACECETMEINSAECCICLEKFLEGEELTQLNCKHTFHSRCLTRWVRAHSDCPYCRAQVA